MKTLVLGFTFGAHLTTEAMTAFTQGVGDDVSVVFHGIEGSEGASVTGTLFNEEVQHALAGTVLLTPQRVAADVHAAFPDQQLVVIPNDEWFFGSPEESLEPVAARALAHQIITSM